MSSKSLQATKAASFYHHGGTRIAARSTPRLAIPKVTRPESLLQAPTICAQLVQLVASNPKGEYSPAEVNAYIGQVKHTIRGQVFAVLGWHRVSRRRKGIGVRLWIPPFNSQGAPMPTPDPAITAAFAMAEADRLKDKSLQLIDLWLDAAGAALREPAKAGRDLNRTGELLMAAGNWLAEERTRIADAERMRRISASRQTP